MCNRIVGFSKEQQNWLRKRCSNIEPISLEEHIALAEMECRVRVVFHESRIAGSLVFSSRPTCCSNALEIRDRSGWSIQKYALMHGKERIDSRIS
jgi:hypothetical protein